MIEVTRWHLRMDAPEALRRAAAFSGPVEIRRVAVAVPEFSRFLYLAVGWRWHWVDRLVWTWADWTRFLARPEIETWVAWIGGAPAGYYELDRRPGGITELLLFGLLPSFIGRGLGGHLLTHAVQRAWEGGATAVTLNTCSLDHPSARAAYLARGFRLDREETVPRELPPPVDGPWAGAGLPLPERP